MYMSGRDAIPRASWTKPGSLRSAFRWTSRNPAITKICGLQSGHKIDKVKEAGLELEDAEVIHTPGIRQYPLTIECRILYSQDQDLEKIPKDILERMYPQDVEGDYPMANRDFHTMYVGEIVDAYIIR